MNAEVSTRETVGAPVILPRWLTSTWLRFLGREQSSRGAGLLRLLTACLMWARFGDELLPLRHITHPTVSVAFFLSTTLLFVGLWSRGAALGAGLVGMVLVHGYGIEWGYAPWTHHHTTVLAHLPLLLALTPCDRSYSVDRWLAMRRARRGGLPAPDERGPSYGMSLIALQTSVIYLFSAYDKSTVGFLTGERLEAIFGWYYWGSDGLDAAWGRWLFPVAAVSTVVLEVVLALGLWVRSLKRLLIPLGLGMHGAFFVLLPVDTFTAIVWCLYIAYLDQDRLHAFLDELQGGTLSG